MPVADRGVVTPYRTRIEQTTMKDQVIHKNPRIQGGVPVFIGTRTPVKNLFDYLEAGETLEQFLFDFPAVDRAKAVAALEMARAALDADAHSAR